MRLALILFAYPICDFMLIFPNYVNAAVRASTIDDYVFNIWIMLSKHGGYGQLQKRGLIERRSNDGNPRRKGHTSTYVSPLSANQVGVIPSEFVGSNHD